MTLIQKLLGMCEHKNDDGSTAWDEIARGNVLDDDDEVKGAYYTQRCSKCYKIREYRL